MSERSIFHCTGDQILLATWFLTLLSSESSSSSLLVTADHWLLNDVMDKRPSPPMDEVGELNVVVVVKIALACLCVNPKSRPTMQQIDRALSMQGPPLSKPFSMITLGELLGHGGKTS